jgi:DNA-binding transcriptional regulator YiaG
LFVKISERANFLLLTGDISSEAMNTPRPLDELLAAAQTATQLESDALAARKQIGQAVKGLRSTTGMNQTMFAASMGVSQSYLSQIETGERTPSSSTINMIAATASSTTQEGINAQEQQEDTTDDD